MYHPSSSEVDENFINFIKNSIPTERDGEESDDKEGINMEQIFHTDGENPEDGDKEVQRQTPKGESLSDNSELEELDLEGKKIVVKSKV